MDFFEKTKKSEGEILTFLQDYVQEQSQHQASNTTTHHFHNIEV